MIKKVGIIISGILLLLLGALLYIKANPPLDIQGISSNAEQAGNSPSDGGIPFMIVVHPQNNGFVNIRLKEVLVNSNEKPNRAKLGIGRSNYMVMFTHSLDKPEEDISFHDIDEYPIKPLTKIIVNSKTIKQYGIEVSHDEKINNLVIKYSYLGIPFQKELDLSED